MSASDGLTQHTLARNLLLYHELPRILKVLSPLPVIVLKGAALAATIYHRIGLRTMGDLDLLVHSITTSVPTGAQL